MFTITITNTTKAFNVMHLQMPTVDYAGAL